MSTIKVDTITDEAGTGAPTFSQGAAVTGNLTASGTITATGTITGGAFSGSGAGLTGVPSSAVTGLTPAFNPVAVTGATPSLDVGSYNFFDNGTLTANTTVSFASVPTNAKWQYSYKSLQINSFDVSTAVYSRAYSVAGQDIYPSGLFFKPDGTKMYVSGDAGNDVNEYTLSTAWDVSTASFLQLFSVNAQDTSPLDLFFKPDGLKMYVVGGAGVDINEYTLSTAWDVTTATFTQAFSTSGQETQPYGVFFKPDGLKMYVCGATGDDVNEYDLSTAWNISTASYLQNFSVSAQDTQPISLSFSADGLKMHVLGATGDDVNEYTLSTAWDVSTASYLQAFSVAAKDSLPTALFFKPDGDRMYFTGQTGDYVYEYDIGSIATITLPASVVETPSVADPNKRVTYEFVTLDAGVTVNLIGEEIV